MSAVDRERTRLAGELRALRKEKGLTQEQAAESIGIHAKHLERLERGIVNPTLATLVAIAMGYRVSLASLFSSRVPSARPSRRSRSRAR